MVKAVDFDRRMLLMITQLAHENQLKQLLLNVLSALLHTLSADSGVSNLVEGITLTRSVSAEIYIHLSPLTFATALGVSSD